MPIYAYERVEGACERCPGRFDELQKLNAEPLTQCPRCGEAVRRTLSSFAIQRGGALSASRDLTPDQIGKAGFTQYKKVEPGVYEKTAGKGPNTIHKPPGQN
jgi:putative FmdB family regulatory protein